MSPEQLGECLLRMFTIVDGHLIKILVCAQ